MYKIYFFIGLFIFSGTTIYSQVKPKSVDIVWGEEQKASKKVTLTDIVGYDDTGIYALKNQMKSAYKDYSAFTLEHYNRQMNQTKSVEVELKEYGKDTKYVFIIHLKSILYLFSSSRNQKTKINSLFVQKINKKSLSVEAKRKKIAEINYEGFGKGNAGNFRFEISGDSSKFLVYYNKPYSRNTNDQFGFNVFDSDIESIWKKDITVPYEEKLFGVEDFEVDNDGNVHLLGIIYKDKAKSKRKGKPNYEYIILSYFNKGNDLKQYPVKIEGKFLTDMKIAINSDNDLICCGFYSEEGDFGIIGSYFIKIDGKTNKIITQNEKEFGIDFITQNMKAKEEKKTKKKSEKGKDVEMFSYDLDDIILRGDGGVVLIGEQYYQTVTTSYRTDASGNTYTTTVHHYYFNDIIVINIAPDGEIEWAEKIAKRQASINDGGFYSSYALQVLNDRLVFVFNDNPKNLNYNGTGKVYYFATKEMIVVKVEMGLDGKQTRESLFATKDVDIITRPLVCEQIARNEMILFGQRKKTHKFARITFKD
jgi:hypothetical protein